MKTFYANYIQKYLGWRNWAVFYYNSIIENIFLFFFIAYVQRDFSNTFLWKTIAFILFSLLSTTYGYLINDYADRELDRIHGKSNTFADDPPVKALLVVGCVFIFSVVFSLPFWNQPAFLLLWGVWIFVATFYSLPPLRFKEKGKVGLILVVLAQRVIPAAIVFTAFGFYQFPDVLILLNYILAKGFSSDMNHQIQDYDHDVKTGTRTSAVELGRRRLEQYFRFMLRYERMALLLTVWLIGHRMADVTLFSIPLTPVLWAGFTFIFGLSWYVDLKQNGNIEVINPFKPEQRDIFQFIHLAFPHVVLPLFLILIIIMRNFYYVGFLIILGIIYKIFSIDKLQLVVGSWRNWLKGLKE